MRQPSGFIRKPLLRDDSTIVGWPVGPPFASDGPAARPTVGFWQRRFSWLAGFIVLAGGLSPAPVAAQQSWLLVTAADAPVYDGKQVIDHVRKGYVSRLLKTSPGWLRVALPLGGRTGWVRAADARVVDETRAGLGLAGHRPASIVEAKLEVDRKTKECSLLAAVPVSADHQLTLGASVPSVAVNEAAGAHANEQPAISLQRQADGAWRLAGSWQELQGALTPGTRSLWLFDAATDAAHRVDLPAPKFGLEVQSRRYPQLPEGIVAMLPIESLGVEFVLQYAQSAAGEQGRSPAFKPVSRIKGVLPRLLDVYRHGTRDFVRVMLPPAGSAERRTWLFRVRGADGSYSNTIAAVQLGQRLTAPATQTAAATPALIDASVSAPSVELLGVEEAKKIVSAAGLIPRVVSQATLRPLDPLPPQALVLRQGLKPLERILAGSSLLLAVDDTVPPDNERFFPPANSPLTAADDIDVGQQFGFVALPVNLGKDARQPGRTPVIDESLLAGQFTGLGCDVDLSSTSALPLAADPGVLLEADVDATWAAKAAMLRQTIEAMLQLPSASHLPGPVGRAIARAIEQTDADLLRAVTADNAEPIPVEQTVDVVIGELGVELNESQRGEALAALADAFARRRSPELADRNTNGRLADDVAIWLIEWLFRHDLLQPTAQTVVVADLTDEPVALFTSSPVDPAWIDRQPLPFVLPGQGQPVAQPTAAATKPAAGAATSTSATLGKEKERRPVGKPLITAGDGPDRVRVPDVVAQLVAEAYKTLVAIGLTAAKPDRLLLSDKVLAATPAATTWVDSGAAIDLNIERRVPQVTGRPLLEARNTLRRHRLRSGTTQRKTFPDDRVVRQEPAAGGFVKPEEAIELDVRVVVPNVTGNVLTAAKATLGNKDLKWGAATKAFNSDRVVRQSPVAGELREHGGSVELTLALAIPDVRGLTLSKANQTLALWDLQSETPNNLARSGDVVRGQAPAAGIFVPHQSQVRLGPVLGRLPDVRGMTIAAAQDRLTGGEDYQVNLIGDLLSDDRVTGQAPAAGAEYERGRSITLDARVYVPNVMRQNIAVAERQIERVGGDLRVSIDGEAWRDDVVYAQRPQGGTLVFPRASVVLIPGVYLPNVRGMSPDEAKSQLSQTGVSGRITSSSDVETANRGMVGRVVVSDQSPAPGVYRRADVNAVNLAVSRYILALRTVPNVLEDTGSSAIGRIQSAGFDVTIRAGGQTFNAGTYTLAAVISALGGGKEFQEPRVMSQSPEGGTQAVAGSTVTIEVRGTSSEGRGFK